MQNITKRETVKIVLIFVASIIAVCFAMYITITDKSTKIYNCSISEISPDYPIEVKEGCRKLRMEKVDKNSK